MFTSILATELDDLISSINIRNYWYKKVFINYLRVLIVNLLDDNDIQRHTKKELRVLYSKVNAILSPMEE